MLIFKKNKKADHNKVYKIRLILVLLIIIFITSILLLRLGYLFIIKKQFLAQQGDSRTVRVVSNPAYRGIIFDRNGELLAVSTPVDTIWANPSIIYNNDNLELYNYSEINKILDLNNTNNILNKIKNNKNKEFIYLKRQVAPDLADKINNLNLPGIFTKREFKRYYPNSEITANLLGITTIDEDGQEGIEFLYNKELSGVSGKKQVLQDRLGRPVQTLKQITVAKPGEDIELSIDLRLQYLAYANLNEAIKKHNALAGVAIILDLKSGEILALVNQPSFNPNDRSNIDYKKLRNRAVTDLFEPGSLLKPFSMAAILEYNNYPDDYIIDTSPGYYYLQGHKISDVRNFGILSLEKALKKSSNVAISKLTLENTPDKLLKLLYNFGFGSKTIIDLPGEVEGWINPIRNKEKHQLAALSFGYGMTATPMQIMQAYYILANIADKNSKVINPISLIKHKNHDKDNYNNIEIENYYNNIFKNTISQSTAEKLLKMLNSVMQSDGTGRLAMIPNYETAGKTGTTKRITTTGYADNSYNAMIIGMAPYPNPKLAMLVYVLDPKENGYYGGQVAGPVFKKTMSEALKLYGIPPNKVAKQEKNINDKQENIES